jgi:Na+/melibiose symporter-like transporter
MALYAVAVTAYSAFSVPYVSLPATLSADVHERTRIIAVRMVFVFLGALLGSAVAPAVVGALGGGRPGYRGMSLVIGACAGSAMLVAWLTIRTRVSATPVANTAGRQKGLLQAVWQDRAFVTLLLRYLLLAAAIAIFTTALPYYSTHLLKQRETFLGLVFLVIVGASILAMPMWTGICRRMGKARALSASMLLLGLAALVLSAVTVAGPGVFACAAAAGIGMAGVQLTAFSLLADAVGERSDRAGALTGVWTAGEKLGLAAGPAVAGPLLAFAGFVSSTGTHVEQSAGALASIRALLGIAPAALIALAWLLSSQGAKEA